jgi:hypothetical protein
MLPFGSPDRDRNVALLSTERLKGIAQLRISSQECPVVVGRGGSGVTGLSANTVRYVDGAFGEWRAAT